MYCKPTATFSKQHSSIPVASIAWPDHYLLQSVIAYSTAACAASDVHMVEITIPAVISRSQTTFSFYIYVKI